MAKRSRRCRRASRKTATSSELKERLQELKRQRSRVRDVLEERDVSRRHASSRPSYRRSSSIRFFLRRSRASYSSATTSPDISTRVAECFAITLDRVHALGSDEDLRIAHPMDLFARSDWSAWQRECFSAERIQPFKQLFRELYPITEQ